jgi:hypothetical protein
MTGRPLFCTSIPAAAQWVPHIRPSFGQMWELTNLSLPFRPKDEVLLHPQ